MGILAIRARKNVSPTILGQIEACLKDAEPEVRLRERWTVRRIGHGPPSWIDKRPRLAGPGLESERRQALDDLHLATRLERLAVGLESEFITIHPLTMSPWRRSMHSCSDRFDTIQSAEGAYSRRPSGPGTLQSGKALSNCGASALRSPEGRPQPLTCGSKAYPAALPTSEVKVTLTLVASASRRWSGCIESWIRRERFRQLKHSCRYPSQSARRNDSGCIDGQRAGLVGTAATVAPV